MGFREKTYHTARKVLSIGECQVSSRTSSETGGGVKEILWWLTVSVSSSEKKIWDPYWEPYGNWDAEGEATTVYIFFGLKGMTGLVLMVRKSKSLVGHELGTGNVVESSSVLNPELRKDNQGRFDLPPYIRPPSWHMSMGKFVFIFTTVFHLRKIL